MTPQQRARAKFLSLLPDGLEEVSINSFATMSRIDIDTSQTILDELIDEGEAYRSSCGHWYGRTAERSEYLRVER
jgi:hypothetical protein